MDWEALNRVGEIEDRLLDIEEELLAKLSVPLQVALSWELIYWDVFKDNSLVMTVMGNNSPNMVRIEQGKPEILEKLQSLAGDKVRVEIEAR